MLILGLYSTSAPMGMIGQTTFCPKRLAHAVLPSASIYVDYFSQEVITQHCIGNTLRVNRQPFMENRQFHMDFYRDDII